MSLKELLLIFSLIGFITCIVLVLYFLYTYKGRRTVTTIILSFIAPVIITLIYPVYSGVSSIVYNTKYNSFRIPIGEKLENIDYLNLYEEIYEKSNADFDLIVSKYHKNIKVFLDGEGSIKEFSIKVVVPKYDKYYLYTSYYEDKELVFVSSNSVKDFELGEYHNLKPYLERMNNLNDNILLDSLSSPIYINGAGIDVSFNYYHSATKLPLTDDPFFNKIHNAYDKFNVLYEEKVVEALNEGITIKLSFLPNVVDENTHKVYDMIKIFEKEYYYKNKDTIELINF